MEPIDGSGKLHASSSAGWRQERIAVAEKLPGGGLGYFFCSSDKGKKRREWIYCAF
jgi:hypothetical protein